jgi:pimeloyl-ACP methyl ester carboxylesterase
LSQHKQTVVNRLAKSTRPEQLDADLTDVLIFEKAVRYALDQGEFYRPADVGRAMDLLEHGRQRLDEVSLGNASWVSARGLVVRGYRSRIDDSVQPYGLVIPDNLDLTSPAPLYVWLHGRNDKGTDLHFIAERMRNRGEFALDDAIVLHPFGRYCNAFKFAGEIDVLEAIDSVKSRYKIDDRRIVLMGFSMGGAGAWHLGAHYPDRWAAMSPGAGFVDTRRYQRIPDSRLPPWYEQKLWGLYDVPAYTRNLFNLPVVSYSGEVDAQKASADIMGEEFAGHGKALERVIGAKMGHRYDRPSKEIILQRMAAERDRQRERLPRDVTLQTRTLRYNRLHWIETLALVQHWADARIDAKRTPLPDGSWRVEIATKNVGAFRCAPSSNTNASAAEIGSRFVIDGQVVDLPPASGCWRRVDGHWTVEHSVDQRAVPLAKRHGLQGPIDDAFLEPFLFVRPTGKSSHPAIDRWVEFEMQHQIERWKALFRGDVRIKDDKDVTQSDRERYHLVLWGDRDSNRVIAEIAEKLPVHWTTDAIEIARSQEGRHSAESCVLAMIYPNPLNPERYVVLNSGPTFREQHDRTNSQQTPKLPDWAVIDVTTPPDGRAPGKIVAAGFFDEQWRIELKQAGGADD